MRWSASAASRSPSTCTASARKSSSWCAPRALHAIADRSKRTSASFFERMDRSNPEYDTEEVYFELLREIGRSAELRVIVDIIAGASAGGINGTMLARALARSADGGAARPLARERRRRRLLSVASARGQLEQVVPQAAVLAPPPRPAGSRHHRPGGAPEAVVVRALALVPAAARRAHHGEIDVRRRDVHGPDQGSQGVAASLRPLARPVRHLDRLYGYRRGRADRPAAHPRDRSPPYAAFQLSPAHGRAVESDFDLDNAGSLAFAARATSSFPGAFPPARIVEMDEVVAQTQIGWPRRAEFIAKSFPAICAPASIRPPRRSWTGRCSTTGRSRRRSRRSTAGRRSRGRSAPRLHRSASGIPGGAHHPGAGLLRHHARSARIFPSAQPVADELGRVIEFNDRVRRLRSIIDSARPHVSELVGKVVTATVDRPISTEDVRAWREQVNSHVARDAGFAYQAYVRLKLASVRAFGAELIVKLRGLQAQSPCRAWWRKSSTPGRCARASSTSGPKARRSNSRRRPPIISRPG